MKFFDMAPNSHDFNTNAIKDLISLMHWPFQLDVVAIPQFTQPKFLTFCIKLYISMIFMQI